MHYLRCSIILALFSLSTFAVNPERIVTVPPNHGEFVGVEASAFSVKGVPNKGTRNVHIHPGVVVDGPDHQGKWQVAMMSKNLPDNPPQQPIKDFHPNAATFGNVDLAPPRNVKMSDMRIWLSKENGGQKETPLSSENLQKLKTAMIPHANHQRPKYSAPPATANFKKKRNRPSRKGPKFPAPPTQGGSSRPQGSSSGQPFPQNPQFKFTFPRGSSGPHPPHVQDASHLHPPANFASSSKHNPPQLARPYPPPRRPAPGRPHTEGKGHEESLRKRPHSPKFQTQGQGKDHEGSGPTRRKARFH